MAKTILVVDDIQWVRKTVKQIFTEADYEVIGEAETGAEAVRLYQKLHPDLVTLDLVMPDLSGIEATRKIMQLDKRARVIMLSGMSQPYLVMEAISAGVRDYLMKPFKAQDLLKSAERALLDDDYMMSKASGSGRNK